MKVEITRDGCTTVVHIADSAAPSYPVHEPRAGATDRERATYYLSVAEHYGKMAAELNRPTRE